ncbi:methyltransferase, FkbM family [Roseivivax lentus]|uniref:Methyltransferase, FkbM family n=1 Tax=Roseivivax lentus TaxID=633194 RepID=A0A1N7MHQ3_9RHOB|nr:FkbM family methyltransferase [Roseivivax lentus]SIS85538.1 methyltransferase, FkbM family [Roseivivax lentus]
MPAETKAPSAFRVWKYGLLRSWPGAVGRRYDRKYGKSVRMREFAEALAGSKDLIGVDLGANLGKYTRRMAEACHHVYAFEPDPWTAEKLRANLDGFDNVTIEEAAIGTAPGTVRLYRRADFSEDHERASEGSSIFAEKSNVDTGTGIDVRVVDFLAFARGLDRDIGVLKIDIEGAEVDLLEALLDAPDVLARIRIILAETHENRILSQGERVRALKARVKHMRAPRINLYWD